MTHRFATGCAALPLILLAACSTGRPHPAASASAASSTQQILSIGRQFAQCVRAHGVPDYPDPIMNGGYLEMPAGDASGRAKVALNANRVAQDACQPILAQLPPTALHSRAPQTRQDMQDLLKFAQCMRSHGIPQWPDPNPDGTFPLAAAGLANEGKSPRVLTAMRACNSGKAQPIKGS